jgi:hypothetical protein
MSNESDVSNTMYDILCAMGKDADFLYENIRDAQSANKTELLQIQTYSEILFFYNKKKTFTNIRDEKN